MANINKIRLSGTTYNIVDESAIHSLDGYSTTAQMNEAITAATNALAESIAEQGYQTASDVQNAITGKADTTAVTQSISNAVAPLFGAVEYDSATNRINFKHDATGTTLAYIDASPFLVDGFLDSVAIQTIEGSQYLVFTWNQDSGKQTTTNIPLSDIFSPDDYYTTAQTQSYVTGYTYDKATIDEKIQDSGTFDPTQYYTKSEVDTALGGKQATLVSGTNIKTVGTQSLLGSGNIALMTARVGTGNDAEILIIDFA